MALTADEIKFVRIKENAANVKASIDLITNQIWKKVAMGETAFTANEIEALNLQIDYLNEDLEELKTEIGWTE